MQIFFKQLIQIAAVHPYIRRYILHTDVTGIVVADKTHGLLYIKIFLHLAWHRRLSDFLCQYSEKMIQQTLQPIGTSQRRLVNLQHSSYYLLQLFPLLTGKTKLPVSQSQIPHIVSSPVPSKANPKIGPWIP